MSILKMSPGQEGTEGDIKWFFHAQIRKSLSFLFGEPRTSSSSREPGHNHRERIWMASQVRFLPFLSSLAESWLGSSDLAQWKHGLMTRCRAFPTGPLLPSPGSSHGRAGWQGPILEPSGPGPPCPTQLGGQETSENCDLCYFPACKRS